MADPATPVRSGADAPARADRASTLELFFDLVFVFTITQVAFIVEHRPSWATVAQALLELTVIFWMYGGFAWLTNTLGSSTTRQRAVLLLGMAAFLLVALAVPRAFSVDGVAFGWAYLLVNVIHVSGFLLGDVAGAADAMRRIGTTNLVGATLILVAGYVGGPWHWWLWGAAIVVQWLPALVGTRTVAFALGAAHFAERHGAMIIIVLGESLVSVALAAEDQAVTWHLAFGVLCGLAASAAMWWAYFAGQDDVAAESFARQPAERRGIVALIGYDIPHLLMLSGVVGLAAGSRLSLPRLTAPTSLAAASLIGGGIAVYMLGLVMFRRVLVAGPVLWRLVGGVLLLAGIPLGTSTGAAAQLLASAALLAVVLAVERRAGSGPRAADRAG